MRASRLIARNTLEGDREAMRLAAEKFLGPQAHIPGMRYTIRLEAGHATVKAASARRPTL